ncbi:aminoglycoside phosphotransferase family protein [Kovacikia minuta CCNUW1]|uniref:phosphotransferase n=1 Tax=Kovacikia minuta TaxID=2931930 RepID=UPI001CCFC799|nr:aminoglycoside phosphotransferase family protein [Kovacikia minuta]UBF28671.1 aminoglycoside phosphotransferase family protein [Kovacikia minuta CCNUW1]
METESRSHLAIRAACEVATGLGLTFERAIVLQHRSNAIIRLFPTNIVARVATIPETVRQGHSWFVREMAVAHYLAATDAPIIPPSSDIAPGLHQHLGLVLGFWKFVEILEQPFDPYQAGQALRACHQALKPFSEDLPTLALLTEARQLLVQTVAAKLSPADVDMLMQVGERSHQRLSQLPMQPLHGDSHSGNVLNTTQGVLWTDWEDTFIGPIEWDLACLVAAPYVLGTDWEKAEAALQGYGDAIDFEVLEDCIVARAFVSVIWYVILQQQRPEAGRLAQLEHYLNWLRQREGRT